MAPPLSLLSDDDRLLSTKSGLSVAVAIDKDKNSQFAVRWALDHLLFQNPPTILLVHVRNRNLQSLKENSTSTETSCDDVDESEMHQLFLSYRGICARKGVQVNEVVLDDTDVPKAILQYINEHFINYIVLGATPRNALIRRLRNPDVPTILMKSAPDFCTVYVISKGKLLSIRSATRPPRIPSVPPPSRQPSPSQLPSSDHSNPEDPVKPPSVRGSWRIASPERGSWDNRTNNYMRSPGRDRGLSGSGTKAANDIFSDNLDLLMPSPHSSIFQSSLSDDRDFLASGSRFRSFDGIEENLEFSYTSKSSPSMSTTSREVEAEMKRLNLELKQTMDMYSKACKEAISAKQRAQELQRWKMEESHRFEEARLAEETALAVAEIEKAKCKAAIEAAEIAKRIAEMEAQKTIIAEMKAKNEADDKKRALDAYNDVRYRKYTMEQIEAATNFFSKSSKIGEGGYGPVYRAFLDHTSVAIKVLKSDAAQGRKQFNQEIEVLSCIRHPNMVLLLGACPEFGCLVYEFMDNGSLEDRLFCRGNTPPIPWKIRFKIATEVATALLFLHQTKPEPIVHRDLKPANILIDRNYVSKISDVGLARLVPPSVTDHVTQYHMTTTAGTFCYIDPEYQQTGMLGVKSDIYSLGIVLLQIITARPPMGLTHIIERAIENGTFSEMLDRAILDWPIEECLEFAKVALKCSELRRKDRPDLASVILPELNRLSNSGGNDNSSSPGVVAGERLVPRKLVAYEEEGE